MATFYVSTTGSDTNSGTSTSPVKTISKAAQLAQAGDTVLVHGGVYNGTVNINKSGTASAPITFKAVSGEHVIIDGSQTSSGTDLVTITGDYVTFQGFEVRNAKRAGISLWETHDTKVLNNNVHDSFRAAIWAGGNTGQSYNNLIEGNQVWHNVLENSSRTWSGGWAQGISLSKSDGSIVRNNNVYDNYGEGIGAMFTIGAKITGNTVYDSYSVGIYLDNAQDAVVQYNTVSHTYDTNFYRNGKPATGIEIANEYGDRMLPSSGLVITNNILAGVGDIHYSTYGANTGLVSSTISPNTIYSSPDAITSSTQPTQPTSADDPVVAMDDSYAATEDAALTVGASNGVLANDTAADGGKVAAAGTFTTSQGGSVKLNADGSFVYTPKANFFGSDSFTYTVKDADGDSDAGLVTFKVADVAETGTTSPTTPTTSVRPTTTKTITGTSSSNTLKGTSGNDLINGKGGDDKIWGMNGSDVLIGGSGKDAFVFASDVGKGAFVKLGSSNVDVIVDFNVADDTIQLGDTVFTKLTYGKLSSSSFVVGEKALDSSDRIIYNNKTGALSYDADGTGSMAAVKFAVIENKAALTAADFFVI